VELNGSLVARETVRPEDEIRVGDTVLAVRLVSQTSTAGRADSGSVAFIRSPRLAPRFEGSWTELPELPQRQAPQRFPLAMLLMPLLMAGVLYLVTRHLSSVLFAALSPLMLVGGWLEQRRSTSRVDRVSLATFRADLADAVAQAQAERHEEVAARLAEHPSTAECLAALAHRTPLLWTRRPGDAGFLELRLGLGRLPSRGEVVLPDARRGPRDLFVETVRATEHLGEVDGVPVVAALAGNGAVGIAGPRSAAVAAARALVVQAAALHSPAELALAVIASSRTGADWDWAKWLPHVGAAGSPLTGRHLVSTTAAATALVSEVESLLDTRAQDAPRDGEAPVVPALLLVVESDAPAEFSRLNALAERGRTAGVHVLWVAPDVAQLPAACRTFVDVRSPAESTIGSVHTASEVTPVVPELLGAAEAVQAARALAPVVDLAARHEDSSDLPRRISFLALDGHELLGEDPAAVIERWQQNHSIVSGPYANPGRARIGSLRAVVGHAAGGLHAVDLRADGPHALVGGTTGSGKSELLQTWILSMAASISPQRLTFLLVDYKGGSAFADCARLPHTVGLVTDLNPNGVRRALTSLAAELRYRERLLHEHKAKDLMALERTGSAAAPPSLVIVVDEFAALVSEVPEFIDGVVNVAQRGRSLGLHLVLATQQPSGVIKDNLRANTNLRLALRVADEADSTDVLGSADAAWFDPDLPGRAVSKTGPGRLVPFQTAYVGGHTASGTQDPDIEIEVLGVGADMAWTPPETSAADAAAQSGPTDIARVVDTVGRATTVASMTPPRRPWLPDLLPVYNLADPVQVPSERRDDVLVYGVQDDPAEQRQVPVAFHPDRHGNLAVFGTGGSGKSTFLRTLAAVGGLVAQGGPCHVYGLDFGASGLSMLNGLPHVGAVIQGSDDERVQRLVRWLRQVVTERSSRYAQAGAGTVSEYRRLSAYRDEPRLLVLLDGLTAMRTAYEAGPYQAVWDQLVAVAAEGRPVGVHFVVTADRPGALPTALASSVQQRVVLRMADVADYGALGVPSDVLSPASLPGRAVVDEREVQVAVLGGAADTRRQAEELADLARAMVNARVTPAVPVHRLPEQVPLSALPASRDGLPVIGVRGTDLEAATVEPSGTFVVAGPRVSGRTTVLRALAESLRRTGDGARLVLLSADRRSELTDLPVWDAVAVGNQVRGFAASMTESLTAEYERLGPGGIRVAVFVEGLPELVTEPELPRLARAVLAADGFVVSEGEVSAMTGWGSGWADFKVSRAGIALQPDPADGQSLFRVSFPSRLRPQDFPPGRGLLVGRGTATTVQVADPDRTVPRVAADRSLSGAL